MGARRLAPVPDRPGRAVLYVRVSALMGRGGDDFHSPDVQLHAMRGAISMAGLREVAVVDDDIDQTGTHFDRAGIDKVRAMAEARQIDAIAVYDVSRFGRNVLESLQFLKWLADRGVTIISACERLDTSTPEGEMMLINMLNLAQYRAREIGRNWGNTIARRAERGQHHGRVPTGYERGDDGRLRPHSTVGPAVREAFLAYGDGGTSQGIRRQLRARTGLWVHATTWRNMLRNETYRGQIVLRGAGPAGRVTVEHAHEALMSPETWRRVQVRLAAEARQAPRVLSPKYSATGLGQCGTCGDGTNLKPDRRRGEVRIYCRRKADSLSGCAGCGQLLLSEVEGEVLAQVREYIRQLRVDAAAQSAYAARMARANADARLLERELTQTRKAMTRLTERWARDQIDDQVYESTMAELRADEERLTVDLAGRRHSADAPRPREFVKLGEKLLALWDRMDGGQRNRALRDIVTAVVVHKGAYYRQPASERVRVQFRTDSGLG